MITSFERETGAAPDARGDLARLPERDMVCTSVLRPYLAPG